MYLQNANSGSQSDNDICMDVLNQAASRQLNDDLRSYIVSLAHTSSLPQYLNAAWRPPVTATETLSRGRSHLASPRDMLIQRYGTLRALNNPICWP